MKRLPQLALTTVLLAGPACAAVKAGDYRQFWLWAGVRAQPGVLERAETLYVLQGEVGGNGPTAAVAIQGVSPGLLPVREVWLAWRVQRLDWGPGVVNALLARVKLWRHRGATVTGIQIDFDARSLKLDGYADFLRRLRPQLPPDCRLSITGLLDWTQTGDVHTLNGLQGIVDEVVVQTYRGRRTEPEYGRYLDSLDSLTLPFKVGLVQGGDWEAGHQVRLARHPGYRGEVVFLVNPR